MKIRKVIANPRRKTVEITTAPAELRLPVRPVRAQAHERRPDPHDPDRSRARVGGIHVHAGIRSRGQRPYRAGPRLQQGPGPPPRSLAVLADARGAKARREESAVAERDHPEAGHLSRAVLSPPRSDELQQVGRSARDAASGSRLRRAAYRAQATRLRAAQAQLHAQRPSVARNVSAFRLNTLSSTSSPYPSLFQSPSRRS